MRILDLTLENFQGMRSATFHLDGRSADIYGDNATGKTTVANAVTWLLFDKPSTDSKSFTPKTRQGEDELHGLEHSVEARCQTGEGITTLKKTLREVWKKKNGTTTQEYSGNTIDYAVDGVPFKEKEYQATLERLLGSVGVMRVLTAPFYFPKELAWEERRRILLEVCGDVTDDDVMAAAPELEKLPAFLAVPGGGGRRYSVEEYRKIAAARKTDLNRQLEGLPGRIDEATRAKPDLTGYSLEQVNSRLEELARERADQEGQRAATLAAGASSAASKAHTAAVDALSKARAEHTERMGRISAAQRGMMSALENELQKTRLEHTSAKNRLLLLEEGRAQTIALRKDLLEEYGKVQAEVWDEQAECCPTCHRSLPADEVAHLRERFNQEKSRRLEKINTTGQEKASQAMIDELTGKYDEALSEAARLKARVERLEADRAAKVADATPITEFENTPEYSTLAAEVARCKAAMETESADVSQAAAPFTAKLEAIETEQKDLQTIRLKFDAAREQDRRIQELQDQEKELGAAYESNEAGLALCDAFVRAKVSMLTDSINGKFRRVRFRLFQEQLNGGLKECCDVLVPNGEGTLVPFADANNAGNINAGLEIIETLARNWGKEMPVIIDNAESVTRLDPVDLQVIRLVVSEQDKALRLEVKGAPILEAAG